MKELNDAIEEYRNAVIENIEAGKAEVKAAERKRKARFRLLKASEHLSAIKSELIN